MISTVVTEKRCGITNENPKGIVNSFFNRFLDVFKLLKKPSEKL